MKKTLLAGAAAIAMSAAQSALAADLPVRMPVKAPPVAAPAFTWTGCYIGAHGGYAWGTKKWSDTGIEFTDHDLDGGLVGGQVGCNIQQDRWVFGIEGQASWADLKGSSFVPLIGTPGIESFYTKTDILGSIAARLGMSFDRTLLFIKGGLAFAQDKHWTTLAFSGGPALTTSVTDKYLRWGWMGGGGFEYAFTGNWSGKVEYNYMDLGTDSVSFCSPGGIGSCSRIDIKQHIHLVKAGFNYRWGPTAVVARY